MDRSKYHVCLPHPFDIRGEKVGGLETYTRDFIEYLPHDFELVMIGVDGRGDLKLGVPVDIEFRGRRITFLPVIRYSEEKVHSAAKSVGESITFQFGLGLLKYFPVIRRLLRPIRFSVDLRRSEFALFFVLLGLPYIQMLHGEGAPALPMDSLLGRLPLSHNISEALAMVFCKKFLCVNPYITLRIKRKYPLYRNKVSTLTTWFNPRVFKPTPIGNAAHEFNIVFCGRLDAFKAPTLMFKAIARAALNSQRLINFHYIGTSDATIIEGYDIIRPNLILHGFCDPDAIARILASSHCGILTSDFEGMPRSVLECLAAGRPVVALNLPQLEGVIVDQINGRLVPRSSQNGANIAAVAQALLDVADEVDNEVLNPLGIADSVREFTPYNLLGRVYQYHREIQDGV